MTNTILGIFLAAIGALSAQQVVAPTQEPVGSGTRRKHAADYNITNSFELGYRWSLVGGDVGEYRSDVNYGNGVRLLGSSLSVDSKDGHGHYFDQILLNTEGLGNDPYQFVTSADSEEPTLSLRHDLAAERLLQSRPDGSGRRAPHGYGAPHTGPRHHAVSTIQIPCARRIQPQCTGRSVADHLAGTGQQQRAQHGPAGVLQPAAGVERIPPGRRRGGGGVQVHGTAAVGFL